MKPNEEQPLSDAFIDRAAPSYRGPDALICNVTDVTHGEIDEIGSIIQCDLVQDEVD